jgi:hypothetical protein
MGEDKHLYDEHQEIPSPWEWVILVLFSAAIMGFGWLVYLLVDDAPRRWDFGQLPDTPAESIYSTEKPGLSRKPKRQVIQLPEAVPFSKKPAEQQREMKR